MSDDDRDIDIESDEENDSDNTRLQHRHSNSTNSSQAQKRAHHNALERKRRDHIKDSFNCLKDAVPSLQGEKVASRAQILKKAAEYIQSIRRKNLAHQQDIEDLKKQNSMLELQVRQLEKAKDSFSMEDSSDLHIKSEPSDSSEGEENDLHAQRSKKMKSMYPS